MSTDETVTLTLQIYAVTDTAVLLGRPKLPYSSTRGKDWVPASLIVHRDKYDKGDIGEFELPLWFAKKKDMIPL